MSEKKTTSRREFMGTAAKTAAGFMIVPRAVLGGKGYTAPSDTVNVAGVGVGGRGTSVLRGMASQNIVALCDVDDKRAAPAYEAFPNAKRYKDFREMLDKQKDIDAVMCATPDHTHGVIGMAALDAGYHLYLEKPLMHNIYEARMLTEKAAETGLITQMGNQGASGEGIRKMNEWVNAGLIGDVHTVHCWTDRPIWPQGVPAPTEGQPVPDTLAWDLWLGPAAYREYNARYLPFKWRGFWDFGTGAIGDMDCHIIDVPFFILELGYPEAVEASVGQVFVDDFVAAYYPESAPPSSKVHLFFPARGNKPPVQLNWTDGGILPQRPAELEPNEAMGDPGGGVIMEGTKGKIMCGVYGSNPTLPPTKLMGEVKLPEPTLPRVTTDHQMDWINGIKEKYQPSSTFAKAGPLAETVLMANLAIRSHDLRIPRTDDPTKFDIPGRGIKLLWDGPNMKITNFEPANRFVKRDYRKGWELPS